MGVRCCFEGLLLLLPPCPLSTLNPPKILNKVLRRSYLLGRSAPAPGWASLRGAVALRLGMFLGDIQVEGRGG